MRRCSEVWVEMLQARDFTKKLLISKGGYTENEGFMFTLLPNFGGCFDSVNNLYKLFYLRENDITVL